MVLMQNVDSTSGVRISNDEKRLRVTVLAGRPGTLPPPTRSVVPAVVATSAVGESELTSTSTKKIIYQRIFRARTICSNSALLAERMAQGKLMNGISSRGTGRDVLKRAAPGCDCRAAVVSRLRARSAGEHVIQCSHLNTDRFSSVPKQTIEYILH
ncbi:unnamed protein product, partial [Brenthis ino]